MAQLGKADETWPAEVWSGSGTVDSAERDDGSIGLSDFQDKHPRLTNDDAELVGKASSSSSVAYSMSDMSLSKNSSCGAGQDAPTDRSLTEDEETNVISEENASSLQFLSESRVRFESVQPFMRLELSREIEHSNSLFNSTASSYSFNIQNDQPLMPASTSLIQEFDFISMREKLEAQKEFLCQSFERPSVLPQGLPTKGYQTGYKTKKPASLKLKGKLHKLGKAARHFLNTKILRHQPSVQRCEIHLDGFDDRVECFILVVSLHPAASDRVTKLHVGLPSAFETSRVLVPRFLLPSKQGETMTVTVCGITGQEASQLSDFRKIVVSGVCTIQFDSRPLLSGRVELQPHRPSHSLAGLSKAVQSGGTRIERTHTNPDSYVFSVLPTPVASDFTELCVLQKADPFRECLALSKSSCNQPAAFQICLSPGQYHAVCGYRLTVSSMREVFAVNAATPAVFFKAYMDKSRITEQMNQAAERIARGPTKNPVPCPTLLLLKPPGLDVQGLMQMIGSGRTEEPTSNNVSASVLEEGLHFCAWDMDAGDADVEGTSVTKSWYPFTTGWTAVQNPRLGSREYTRLPSLSVFNMSTRLYFADYWNFYDKHYVTLVLCTKGSPCHHVCKHHLQKLDPYNNPFLFRRRYFDPEPSVAVYTSASVNVGVIHSNSASIQQLVSASSENVFFSKVRIVDSSSV